MRAWIAGKGTVALHFTNYKAGWGRVRFSTGFVESIVQNGARPFLNVGVGDFPELRHAFQHHGYRCNKRRVNGDVAVPAVIILNISGLPVQQGYDHELHLQVNTAVTPDRVLGWFVFDNAMSDLEFEQKVNQVLAQLDR